MKTTKLKKKKKLSNVAQRFYHTHEVVLHMYCYGGHRKNVLETLCALARILRQLRLLFFHFTMKTPALVLCQNFRNMALTLRKTVMETHPQTEPQRAPTRVEFTELALPLR